MYRLMVILTVLFMAIAKVDAVWCYRSVCGVTWRIDCPGTGCASYAYRDKGL